MDDVAPHVADNAQLSLAPEIVLRRTAVRARRGDTLSESERMAIDLDQTDREIHNRLASLLKQAEASSRANRAKAVPAAPPAPAPAPKPIRVDDEPAAESARPIALQSRAEREFMKAMEARK